MPTQNRYIPALSFRWLTPLYDPLLKWGMREQAFKRRLIQFAHIQPGQKVLDLGCGTGTLTLMLKQAVPGAIVTGVDGDPEVLATARSKAAEVHAQITWDQSLAYDLLYADGSFDVVLSSLVVHHLAGADEGARLSRGAAGPATRRPVLYSGLWPTIQRVYENSGGIHDALGRGS